MLDDARDHSDTSGSMNEPSTTLLTAEEAAQLLRCSIPSIRRFARNGALPHIRYSRRLYFRRADLLAFIADHLTLAVVKAVLE